MAENNNRGGRFPLRKTKRLDTIKKKAKELSILCNIDVALVGTHQDPSQLLGPSPPPVTWHTYPDDKSDLARILDRYDKKMKEEIHESSEGGSSQGPDSEFDLDKAVETMTTEELQWVYHRIQEIERAADQKLDSLLNNQTIGVDTPLMIIDSPMENIVKNVNSDEVDYQGIDTTPVISDSPMEPPAKDSNNDEVDYQGVRKGFKLFGFFIEVDEEVQNQISSQSSQPTEIRSQGH